MLEKLLKKTLIFLIIIYMRYLGYILGLITGPDQTSPTLPKEDSQDIILCQKGGGLRRISQCHPTYTPLHYVLLFLRGELGWHWDIPLKNAQHMTTTSHKPHKSTKKDSRPTTSHDPDQSTKTVSQINYYAYRLFSRHEEYSCILHGGKLLQKYVLDSWASSEQCHLNWINSNQKTLRAELYTGIVDAFSNDTTDPKEIGQKIIFPATFPGSPRYMHTNCQKSFAVAREKGVCDALVTLTRNPAWDEIQAALLPGQTASDHPDFVTQVFEQKKEDLLDLIVNKGVLGKVVAHVYTIEFQKRGMPHMHPLLWFAPEDKI